MHGALKNTPTENPYAHKEAHCPEWKPMLGSAALRFSVCGSPTTKVTCRHPSTPTLARNSNRAWATSWLESFGTSRGDSTQQSIPSINCHSSSCALAKHGVIRATIWHALLPSSYYLSVSGQDKLLASRNSRNVVTSQRKPTASALGNSGSGFKDGSWTGFKDGSWNVACDARPARWLHGRDSAWLLFGFCSCFSLAASAASAKVGPEAVACCEANTVPFGLPEVDKQEEVGTVEGTHGKTVYKDYSVIGIPGDGRCLFRAVAHGICTRGGKATNNEEYQREFADDLRSKVVDELVKRRAETEWFIEGDFDVYAERMREPQVWGGEPELLMLSHILQTPITVYMSDRSSDGLIAIAEYGQEYGKDNPVRVLYHGFGHYDALQMPTETSQQSKL